MNDFDIDRKEKQFDLRLNSLKNEGDKKVQHFI